MNEQEAFRPAEHMLKLKGQLYLQVRDRVTWFRQERADSYILTDLVEHDAEKGEAVFKARAGYWSDERQDVFATGYGSESRKDFGDYLEKAETKAVGRALAFLGYGTSQALDLDEGGSVADSPVTGKAQPRQQAQRTAPVVHEPTTGAIDPTVQTNDPDGALRAAVRVLSERDEEGRSKLPKRITDMTRAELEKTRDWLQKRAAAIKKGQTTWVDPGKPLRVAGWDGVGDMAPEALEALRTLILNLLDDDHDMQGIYAAQGIVVAEMDEDEAAREFALLKERAERRAAMAVTR